jgi:hypothetical protein
MTFAAVERLSKPMAFAVNVLMMTVDQMADDENKSQSLLDREVQLLKASTEWIF